jgi:hypothetical protein
MTAASNAPISSIALPSLVARRRCVADRAATSWIGRICNGRW